MGRYINPDAPMSDEDKEFLRGRAREDEVIENERRFPPDGEPAPHEAEGYMPTKVGYDYETQAAKTEDAIGLPVERLPVDEAGRPMIAEYGYVDATVLESELADDEDDDETAATPASESDDEEGEIDDDILDRVTGLTVEELKAELEELGEKKTGNKEELAERLANRLQDDRDKANEADA